MPTIEKNTQHIMTPREVIQLSELKSIPIPDLTLFFSLMHNAQGDNLSMRGKIRTKEKCPKCGQSFEDIGWTFICKEHFTTPNRYFIDIPWKGKQHKIYSDNDGRVLNSYELAKRVLIEIRQKIDKPNYSFDPADYVAKKYTLLRFDSYARIWVQKYYDQYQRNEKSKSTWSNRQNHVEKYFIPFFKTIDIREIRTGDIEDFYFSLPIELKIRTKQGIMKSLIALFNYAKRRHDIKNMPDFPEIKAPEPITHWIDEDSQDRIYAEISPDHQPIFLFMMRQGVRPGEARALHFEDIDWKNKTVTICRAFSENELKEYTKGKNVRILPLDDDVYQMFSGMNMIRGFVFQQKNGQPYSWNWTLRDIWNKACKKAGFGHIKLKDGTRHSFASQAANRGVPLYLIQWFLGHKGPITTQRYTHLVDRGLKIVLRPEAKVIRIREKR